MGHAPMRFSLRLVTRWQGENVLFATEIGFLDIW
jgi:hypothetical protein